MAIATITVVLPAARTDGSAFTTAMYGGAQIFANGQPLTTLVAPNLVATDPAVVPGVTVYTAQVSDNQVPPVVSGLSAGVTAGAAPELAAPNAPSLTVTVA